MFTDEQLIYAATARCHCGAGLAHPANANVFQGHWSCSDALKLTGEAWVIHATPKPFAFVKIDRETETQTTRPGSKVFMIKDSARTEPWTPEDTDSRYPIDPFDDRRDYA